MNDILIWEEPPPIIKRGRQAHDFTAQATELKRYPGQWAILLEDAWLSRVKDLKTGKYPGLTAGEFEFRTFGDGRKPRGKGRIYARYVGQTGLEAGRYEE